jgi:hypothetical protein
MQEFPALLKKLMEKDYGNAIRAGFECTGLFPFNPDRVLSKLPTEDREVTSQVHQVLLNKLADMRYKPSGTARAQNPKKKEKLPAGASYTCAAGKVVVAPAVDMDEEVAGPSKPRQPSSDTDSSDSNSEGTGSDFDSSSDSEEERSRNVKAILERLSRKRPLLNCDVDEEEEEEEDQEKAEVQDENEHGSKEHGSKEQGSKKQGSKEQGSTVQGSTEQGSTEQGSKEQTQKGEELVYLPNSYVVVLYGEDWYVGQVIDKEGEPEAEEDENYVFISFMKRTAGDLLQWPNRLDLLNVLKEDILFMCQAPAPSPATSSSRSTTFSLSKGDLIKAKKMFMIAKAYYPTNADCVSSCVCVCVWVHLGSRVCVCVIPVYECSEHMISSLWDNNFRTRKVMPRFLAHITVPSTNLPTMY